MRSASRSLRRYPAAGSSSRPGDDGTAAAFAAAVAEFEAAQESERERRAEFTFEEVEAPRRLAPFAAATAATVRRGDADIAWGRLVVLYDPAGQAGWPGCCRLISYLRAEIEPEIAADPMLGEVGWSWLTEALDARVPGYLAPSGTVTRATTEGFGAKEGEPPVHGFELRASWSPAAADRASTDRAGETSTGRARAGQAGETSTDRASTDQAGETSTIRASTDRAGAELAALDLAAHLAAWCDSLAAAAGLPPLAPGTRAFPGPTGTGRSGRRRR